MKEIRKKNLTQKIDSFDQHKLFREEKGFNEIKNKDNNLYNIELRITDKDEDEE